MILYASLKRDTGSVRYVTVHGPQALGKTILEATRDEDEPSLRVKLLDLWTVMIADGIEVPKGKVQSLSRLLAGLVDLEEAADRITPTLKSYPFDQTKLLR